MPGIEYLTDKEGRQKAVVIPIALWRKIMPQEGASLDQFPEEVENYCLNKAMDEAEETRALNKEDALRYLEE